MDECSANTCCASRFLDGPTACASQARDAASAAQATASASCSICGSTTARWGTATWAAQECHWEGWAAAATPSVEPTPPKAAKSELTETSRRVLNQLDAQSGPSNINALTKGTVPQLGQINERINQIHLYVL